VFKAAVRTLVSATREALEANGATIDQVRYVFCHQANIRILEAVMDRLGVPMERLWRNIHKYGNTSAASVPMALDEANRAGGLARGDLALMLAVGAGVSWGSALVRW
jgi:3-oxoacyl-[acyl-carrier-protein] synthase-3